jgi:hypothetical protein
MLLRGLAPALALLLVFGLVRPAQGQEYPQTTAPVVPARPMPQTWAPIPNPPVPAGASVTCPAVTCAPVTCPVATCPTVTCAPAPEPTPVYTHWTFWLTVAVVAAAGVLTGVLVERRNHGLDMPSTTFGTKQF